MPLDRNQLKMHGVRYAKSLQMLIKTVMMFSAEHPGAQHPFQHSFVLLNLLLKQTRQFTIGFVDNRLMLNNVLTPVDSSLSQLENEFLKRGIGAVTFDAGLTLAGYKKSALVLSVNPKHLVEIGGLLPWVELNKTDHFRVFPASKNEMRTEDGDTVLEVDSESFLLSKAMSDQQSVADPFEMLLQSHFSGGGGGGTGTGGGGTGSGTESPSGGSNQAGGSGTGKGAGDGSGGGFAFPQKQFSGNPTEMLSLVDAKFEQMLHDPKDEPMAAQRELAQILRSLRPDAVLSSLSPDRQKELMGMPRELMQVELFEDATLRWAVNRLTNSLPGGQAVVVEGEIIGVLLKSLQATQNSVRLGRKLAEMAKDKLLPRDVHERLQEELRWVTLTNKMKFDALMAVERFTPGQFRRLLDLIKELMKQGKYESVEQLANHYMTFLQVHQMQPEDLSRLPELLRGLAGIGEVFWNDCADVILNELARSEAKSFIHMQCVNALQALTHTVIAYENFDLVIRVGSAYEAQLAADSSAHHDCCAVSLQEMISDNAVERIIEIFRERRDDMAWVRSAATMLRWKGEEAINKVFTLLEMEQNTAVRLAFIRLIGRLGPAAINAARQMIFHNQWYVVRNGCRLLGEIKDPELLSSVAPALVHADERVQKTAVKVLHDNRTPGRGAILAAALSHFPPQLLEETLNELMFLRDPESVSGIREFIFYDSRTPQKLLFQAINVLGAVGDDNAAEALIAIVADTEFEQPVRTTALNVANRNLRENARRALAQFATNGAAHDPLVTLTLTLLAKSGRAFAASAAADRISAMPALEPVDALAPSASEGSDPPADIPQIDPV